MLEGVEDTLPFLGTPVSVAYLTTENTTEMDIYIYRNGYKRNL